MTRLRAVAYAVLVAVVVFYYLATPTLRGLFGPAAVLPAYAAVGILAGAITYGALRYLTRLNERLASVEDGSESPLDRLAGAREPRDEREDRPGEADAPADDGPDVDQMLGELAAEREETAAERGQTAAEREE